MSIQTDPSLGDLIHFIRDQRVMLDRNLATLYGVETKVLNQAVKRNISRFPIDFMFQLTEIEEESLRSQFVTSNGSKGGQRYQSYVFTELGIAMLSSILRSDQAIQTNIAIMRTFFELRHFLNRDANLADVLQTLERESNHRFRIIFHRLDQLEIKLPTLRPSRRKIGI